MSQTLSFTSSKLAGHKTATASSRSRATLVVRAQKQQNHEISRREAGIVAAAAMVASLSAAAPAHALFGMGAEADTKYTEETAAIIKGMTDVLELEVSDPSREDKLKALKNSGNDWVARYRRDSRFSGRPSYGNAYTAVNALAGHLNSFGYTAGIPKKRLERIQKELSDADKLLQRGR